MMYDLARIRYVTEHYRDLQGLTVLPLSLWLLAWAGYDLGWIRPTGWLAHEWLLFPVSVVLFLALTWPIEKLYERAFGRTAPAPSPAGKISKRRFFILWACLWLAWMVTDMRPEVGKLGVYILFGLLMEWQRRSNAKHLVVFSTLIAVITVAPLFDATLYPSATARDVAIKVVAAAGFLAVGTIDHLLLVRTLGPVRREEESRA